MKSQWKALAPIVVAVMFALGYDKTGLGRRITLLLVKRMGPRTLSLGYAVKVADTRLAPFTPSNTARRGGTICPVIRNLPMLCGSKPGDPQARKIGSCIMWVAIASTCITGSMFLTALAPNLLAVERVNKSAKVNIAWAEWFLAFAPVGIGLLLLSPLITYWVYPPEIKSDDEVPIWAASELGRMGGLSGRKLTLAVRVLVFSFTHHLFASVTAHVTALLPVMLAVGATIVGIDMRLFALLLCLTLGVMGVLTTKATGPGPVYCGSGYLPARDYGRLGAIFGLLFIAVLLVLGLPWLPWLALMR